MATSDLHRKHPLNDELDAELEREGYYWKKVERTGTSEEWFLFDPIGTEVTFEEAIRDVRQAKLPPYLRKK